MKNRNGFTIVELAIVIAIMGVLLVLGVAKLNESQVTARDHERASDAANIARFMEDYYKANNGTYPATDKITTSTMDSFFDNLNKASLKAPGQTSYSLTAESNSTPTIDQYVYTPYMDRKDATGFSCVGSSASVCGMCTSSTTDCRAFTIYYRTEADNAVKTIVSEKT